LNIHNKRYLWCLQAL